MRARFLSRLTYANVVATLALFIALGGGAVAAKQLINGRSIKPRSIPGNRLKDNTVTGQQVNLTALGKVPDAAVADTATDATKLGGSPASDYRLRCPSGLQQAGGLCFEPTVRTAATWEAALETCMQANLRLPDMGDLTVVFNNTGASQPIQWTTTSFESGGYYAVAVADTSARSLVLYDLIQTTSQQYRCVTSATN